MEIIDRFILYIIPQTRFQSNIQTVFHICLPDNQLVIRVRPGWPRWRSNYSYLCLMQILQSVDFSYAKVQLLDLGIVRLQIFGKLEIGENESREMNNAIGLLSGGKEVLVLIMAEEITQFNKGAMMFSASEEGLRFTKADALVVKSIAQKITANFYLLVNAPKKPSRIFNSESEAIEWLLSLSNTQGIPQEVLNRYL